MGLIPEPVFCKDCCIRNS